MPSAFSLYSWPGILTHPLLKTDLLMLVQAMMAASEQGWNATNAAQALSAAGQICHAHAVAQDSMTNCIFVTHVGLTWLNLARELASDLTFGSRDLPCPCGSVGCHERLQLCAAWGPDLVGLDGLLRNSHCTEALPLHGASSPRVHGIDVH